MTRNPSTGVFLGDAASLTDGGQPFGNNTDIATDGGFFYSIATGDARIRKFDLAGHFLGDAGVLGNSAGPKTNQIGIATDGQFFYTIASADARVRKFALDGNFVGDVAVLTNSIGLVTDQTGIDTDGQYFYTISNGDSRVRKFALDGNFLGDFLNLTDGGSPFGNNTGIAILSGIHVSIRISQVELCWNTVTNKQYQIQYRSSLTTNIWTDFGALINGTGASTCATDAVLSDQPRRYYRVVPVP